MAQGCQGAGLGRVHAWPMSPRLPPLLCAALLLAGCPPPTPEPLAVPEAHPWSPQDVRPALEHPFFGEHPALQDLSLYSTAVAGPEDERPDHQHRGAFAVGNGRTFALSGLVDPLNTLHSLVGPVYQRETHFFGDTAIVLLEDGVEVPFEREWIARPRGTGVLITRADTARHTLYTVDFAPQPAGDDALQVPPLIGRIVLVQATQDSGALALGLRTKRTLNEVEGLVVETVDDATRWLAYLPWEAGALQADGQGWQLPLGALSAGESSTTALALATGRSLQDVADVAARIAGASPSEWLDDTLAWWAAFSARGVQLTMDDPRAIDLYDGMRVGIKQQQSAAGAVCPMSQYTLVWLRDTIGPVRFFLRAGLVEEATAALDYTFLCASIQGDYGNACDSGYSPQDLVSEPDWDALGGFSGRLAAEGPSYVPLMYREHARWTGDLDRAQARWRYLRRGLLGQQMDAEGLQPFSGDETFRVAMSAALGYGLTFAYEEEAWSANSAFLMAAAADWMAEAALATGNPEDAPVFAEQAALARSALSDRFLLPEGHHAPFILKDGEIPETQPFEDVNLKPLWTGAMTPDDPAAWADLSRLLQTAGQGDGIIQSPLDPQHLGSLGLPIEEGVLTGMVPGYALWTLSALGHEQAQGAFNQLDRYADTAGQYDEYMVYDDLSAFSPIYDAVGFLGDYTARHRPWEGGINLDAFLSHLTGPVWRADGGMLLRPRLVNDLPEVTVGPLQVGSAQAEVRTSRLPGALRVQVSSRGEAPFPLQVQVPVPADVEEVLGATVDGEPVDLAISTLPGGERLVEFPVGELAPGATRSFAVLVP